MDYGKLDPLRADPLRSGVLTDLDGTVSAIAPTPEDAYVAEDMRQALRMLDRRYRLVAVVSGRPAANAREKAGVSELVYSGNHGLELISDGKRRNNNIAGLFCRQIERVRTAVSRIPLPGVEIEDKGIGGFAVHFRNAPDQNAGNQVEYMLQMATKGSGLVVSGGRKVFEVRPPVQRSKADVVSELCRGHGLENAVYLGDDLTDIDAFYGLSSAGLKTAVRIAVDSPEAPDKLKEDADIVLPSQEEVIKVFSYLLE